MGLTDLVIYTEGKVDSTSDEDYKYRYSTREVFGIQAGYMDVDDLDIPVNTTLEEIKKFIKNNVDKMCEENFVSFDEYGMSNYINVSIILSLMVNFLHETGNERVSYTFT